MALNERTNQPLRHRLRTARTVTSSSNSVALTARQLDIPGRSTMINDALVAAIGNAQANSDTRKAS